MRRTAPACESRGHPLSQKFVPAPLGEEPRLRMRTRPGVLVGAEPPAPSLRPPAGGRSPAPPQNARLRLKFGSAPRLLGVEPRAPRPVGGWVGSRGSVRPRSRRLRPEEGGSRPLTPQPSIRTHPPEEPPAPPEEPRSPAPLCLGSSRELGPLPRGRTGCAGFVHPKPPYQG